LPTASPDVEGELLGVVAGGGGIEPLGGGVRAAPRRAESAATVPGQRENAKMRKKIQFAKIVNLSISQTVPTALRSEMKAVLPTPNGNESVSECRSTYAMTNTTTVSTSGLSGTRIHAGA
jgi:predicted secreted protein